MSPPNRVNQIADDSLRALFTDGDPHALYESFQSVGSGNFGTVFYAQDKTTRQVVAIKKIHYNVDDRNKKDETWRMVVKEITVMNQCNHPHLVKYFNCFLRPPEVYIVMEYCLGSTADILNVNGSSLDEPEIAVICNQTLQALVYLHDREFIHRDVKACNILLSADGKVKLGDFGTVSLKSEAASFIGTPYWMAPEVIKSEDEIMYTQTIDVWSLGICCFEFTTGYPPYHAMHVMAALYHIPNNKPDLKPFHENNYSSDLVNFVSQCFKDFEERPTSKYLLENDHFICAERPANLLPSLLERTIKKVEQSQRNQTNSNKLKLNGKQKLLLAPVTGSVPNVSEFSSPGSDSTGAWTPDSSELARLADSVDEPVYRNLLPDAASANGGYENLESVVNVNTSGNIYENRETASLASSSDSSSNLTDSRGKPPPPNVAQVVASTNIISLSPNRMERQPAMLHGASVGQNSETGLSKIATIKTQNLQQQEEKSRLEMREQMSGYKEMRREHQKQIQALEARCKAEELQCTNKIQQEYDNEKARAYKEEAKARQGDVMRLQQKDREMEKKLAKLANQVKEQQAAERKKFESFQKKYRKNKENEIKEQCGTQKDLLAQEMANLETEQTRSREEAEAIWAGQLKERLLTVKRQLLKEKQELENEILNGEMQRRSVELDLTNRMIIRHHEHWAQLQTEHQKQIQDLRYKLMTEQHDIELQNHRRYHQTSVKDMEKRHLEETRSQPKMIRDKEKQIRNQLDSALDTQNKQYMQLKMLKIEEAPREAHKDLARKLESEQALKQETLKCQYKESIERMRESNESNLKRQHQLEMEELKQRLKRELETLINYQTQVKYQAEQQRNKEKQDLEKKIEARFKSIQKTIEEGKKTFSDEKKKRETEKRMEQAKKMQEFLQEVDKAMSPYHNRYSTMTAGDHNFSPPHIQGMESSFSGTLGEHGGYMQNQPETPNNNHKRHSRVLDQKFSEMSMSMDNSQTPPPPIPRTTSIKQSIDSRKPSATGSTLLQVSQRSSTSSNSSFQDVSSSSFNSPVVANSSGPPNIVRNNSNVSSVSAASEHFNAMEVSTPLARNQQNSNKNSPASATRF